MRIFIAGSHSITELPHCVKRQISRICDEGWHVLVGDYFGLDLAIQNYLVDMHYDKVTVCAPYGRAYNNAGGWLVKRITPPAEPKLLLKREWKNLAMAESADCGLILWDGESRIALQNIVWMTCHGKPVNVWLKPNGRLYRLKGPGAADKLVALRKSLPYGLQ